MPEVGASVVYFLVSLVIFGNVFRISKHKNTFAKGYVLNQSEEIFVMKKVKNTVPWKYVIGDLKGKEVIETFYKN